MLYHDSQAAECRAPLGAVPCGRPVRLRLFGTEKMSYVGLVFIVNGERSELEMCAADEGSHEIRLNMPETPSIVQYFFYVQNWDGAGEYYGNAWDGLGGVGVTCGPEPVPYQITVYDPAYTTPDYLRTGVMYQVFPDRFYRQHMPKTDRTDCLLHKNWDDMPIKRVESVKEKDNYALDFFGGTLNGIAEKLDYLRDLGVTVLYLNPIFKARTNHRYDTGDYTKIDPFLGTDKDFRRLCELAKEKGIRIILDGVFSHTGFDSLYFNAAGRYPGSGAYQSRKSPYYGWYRFRRWPRDYRSWWGIKSLPELDKDNPDVREYFLGDQGIVRRWLKEGASGWRLDVADELPMSYLRELRIAARAEKPDAAVIGEVWEDASHKVTYGEMRSYCLGDTVDSVMNYPLRTAALNFMNYRIAAWDVARLIRSQQENYAPAFYYSVMNLLGSHDRPRALSLFIGEADSDEDHELPHGNVSAEGLALGKAKLREAYRLLASLPGIPCVYYGDECGMRGTADPYCRGTFPWGHEDKTLQAELREILACRTRRVFQTGTLHVYAENADTLVIVREITAGHDVFGMPAENDRAEVRIRRP